jgi:subtilisin family serine protease
LRRALALCLLLAALGLASAAAASLTPVRREFGETEFPRVRPAPAFTLPTQRAEGRIRVLVRLRSTPLAAWNARRLASTGARERLDAAGRPAVRYLAALAREQESVERTLLAAVPGARVERRYAVLLNALAIELPARSLSRLTKVPGVSRVYPSLRYTLSLNTSPGVIAATSFGSATGATGKGVKIAVVDDGVDARHRFLDPGSFSSPSGFPKGNAAYTSGKVIVARSFPAPGAPASSALPFDPRTSFHATHVAGIAAGVAGTTAPPGVDHPETAGLSGVAPRAWIGSYRVFSIPTPIGESANTPEIVAAFEQAVLDGMDVINFSGGGPEIEPANDALIETVRNVALAGVVPVVSAGNERDNFGLGSVSSPGTAPDAITVAAVSNAHVFAPAISLHAADAPADLRTIPYRAAGGAVVPAEWESADVPLVDVRSLQGTDGSRVDSFLCAPGSDPNAPGGELPPQSLTGAVALASRGACPLVDKVDRVLAAGAVGLVLVDNRPGEANEIPIDAPIPTLMIADLDGARLRSYLGAHGGRGTVGVGREPLEIVTGRAGVVTSFSSGGPSPFRHELKPDLAAPGGQVLSSTASPVADSPFAVFDGTSMAAPHVSGSAALLLERHPDWQPWQIKSALVSTAGPAWADTARTREAPVPLAGGGLVDVERADQPMVVARPAVLSLGDLDTTRAARSSAAAVTIADAGGGGGTWTVEVRPQASSPGTAVSAPREVTVPAAGEAEIAVAVRAAAGAPTGDNYGFIVLRRGAIERRIPYLFLVSRPGLASALVEPLGFLQRGSTAGSGSRTSAYRFPPGPFGPFHDPDEHVVENGAETVYSFVLDRPVVNVGVAAEPLTPGAEIDPFLLGALDENTVQGFAGTPTNVNAASFTYLLPTAAAGAGFPTAKRLFVSVDSPQDPATGRPLGGSYLLHAWVDDLVPPFLQLETRRISGRSGIVAVRAFDADAGVDPLSLTIVYGNVALGATAYDPFTGLALFPVPAEAPLRTGANRLLLVAADYQEAKNVIGLSTDSLPNTGFAEATVTVVTSRPVATWLEPAAGSCAPRPASLLVEASGPRRIRLVRFYQGDRLVATDRRPTAGSLFEATVPLHGGEGNRVRLRAIAVDAVGATAAATRTVFVCR